MPNIIPRSALDEKIVLFGQSCVGKTTFANLLSSHTYYCFDGLFHWHLIETLGLSIEANFCAVREECTADKYVLDGWHLADRVGKHLPRAARVYLIFAPYDQILKQYRIPVTRKDEYLSMFARWYTQVDYGSLNARYFLNSGDFVEVSESDYSGFLKDVIYEL